jgi:hypothetical protein
MAWEPGMKQVVAACEACGGPGITTEEGLAAGGGKLIHKDSAICANVRRNTKDTSKRPAGQRT